VVICPTDREASGLARSSRNERLSPEGRIAAAGIHRVLVACRSAYATHSPASLENWAMAELAKDPLIQPEYFRFVHPQSLEPVTDWNKQPAVWVLIAAWVSDVRLIDNDYLFT
jgi:pantoate--beta-alanine ligase